MICLWFGPPLCNYWFSLTLARSGCRINQVYSCLFIILIYLIFLCFRYDASTDRVGCNYANRIVMYARISLLRVTWGPRVNLVDCKSALNLR